MVTTTARRCRSSTMPYLHGREGIPEACLWLLWLQQLTLCKAMLFNP